jgi:hypothetical protein
MFRLHDRTRRRICYTAFVLLCVAPAVFIFGYGIHLYRPGYVSAEAERLGRQLGLDVAIDDVKYPRPGVVLYEGLCLSDPETRQTLLRCQSLEAEFSRTTDAEGRGKPSILLVASRSEIQADGIQRLWPLIAQGMELRGHWADRDVRFAAGNVTLKSAQAAAELSEVQGGIERLTDGSQAQITFRLADNEKSQPARVRVVRNRQVVPPATGFEIDTAGGTMPCSLLAIGIPEMKALGANAQFCGYLWANQASGEGQSGWDGELTGLLTDIDLDQLVTARFPHRLSGTAQLAVQSARFNQSRLEKCACTLTAGPGMIGRSLLEAAANRMSLSQDPRFLPSGDMVRYQQLSLAAMLDSDGLRLQGRCDGDAHGAIISDGRNPLLGDSAGKPLPFLALLQTLVPRSEWQMPVTRQTDWLVSHLPMPRAASAQSPESTANNPR